MTPRSATDTADTARDIEAVEVEEQAALIDALVQTSFATMAVLNRVAAEHDLSLTQLRVLAILRDRRLRVTSLADHLGLEKSTVSGLVDRSEKRGLVERAASENDRRAVEVFLSADGHELATRVYAQIEQSLSSLTDRLDRGDQQRLRRLLEGMLEATPL